MWLTCRVLSTARACSTNTTRDRGRFENVSVAPVGWRHGTDGRLADSTLGPNATPASVSSTCQFITTRARDDRDAVGTQSGERVWVRLDTEEPLSGRAGAIRNVLSTPAQRCVCIHEYVIHGFLPFSGRSSTSERPSVVCCFYPLPSRFSEWSLSSASPRSC